MQNIIKKETEGKVIEIVADASYVPCFKELRKRGFRIPDLEFRILFLPNNIIPDLAEIYVTFENYGTQHFMTGLGDPHEGEDFTELMKEIALTIMLEYEFLQRELLADLDEAELIFEELGWDSLDEDCECECSCDEDWSDEPLAKNEIINMDEYQTLYTILNPAMFPSFALLMSAGFEVPEVYCKVEFTDNQSDKRIGTYINFYYKFDGYGDFCLIRSLSVRDLDEELTPALLTELAYELVEDVPAFYYNLIKNLPQAKCMIKKMERTSEIFESLVSTAKLNLK